MNGVPSERRIVACRRSSATRDGDGVAIQRLAMVGDPATDPLLLLDELCSPYRADFAGGFPPHPHRGMQTLTYMKQGGIIHEDSMGNRGEISGGGAQWMSAGSGVIHAEMPTLDTQGLHGFQLWFNLPAAQKMAPPRYRDVALAELAPVSTAYFDALAIAGAWQIDRASCTGPLTELAEQAGMIDLSIRANAAVTLEGLANKTVVAYVYQGDILGSRETISAQHLLLTSEGASWTLSAGEHGAQLLVIAGVAIGEPVVGYGPFVMNTRTEIEQALRDYQTGDFIKHPVHSRQLCRHAKA